MGKHFKFFLLDIPFYIFLIDVIVSRNIRDLVYLISNIVHPTKMLYIFSRKSTGKLAVKEHFKAAVSFLDLWGGHPLLIHNAWKKNKILGPIIQHQQYIFPLIFDRKLKHYISIKLFSRLFLFTFQALDYLRAFILSRFIVSNGFFEFL